MKNQLLELSENSRIEEEKARASVREKDNKISELTANLAASQKQVEDYVYSMYSGLIVDHAF